MNAYQIKAWKETDRKALLALGAEIYDLPKEERERWRAVMQPYIDKKIAALKSLGVQIKKIMDEANSAHP